MSKESAAYGVSEEALSALEKLIKQIEELQNNVVKDAKSLQAVFDENSSGLGSHSDKIKQLLEMLAVYAEDNGPVKTLTTRLRQTLMIRRHHVAHSVYGHQKVK